MSETIWYEDPRGFVTAGNLLRIVPTTRQTYAEQLNAVFRLSIIYGVVVALLRRSFDMLLVPIGVGAVTFLLYRSFRHSGRGAITEPWKAEGCVRPTKQNPFMNVLGSEDRTRSPACDPLDPAVKDTVQNKFEESMFYDVDDVWARNNAGRNFYTMPSTTVPNDQTSFAEWLYSGVRAGGKQTRPPRNAIF
eukprot:jgi/Tetstr1/464133/TSEL_008938.t1